MMMMMRAILFLFATVVSATNYSRLLQQDELDISFDGDVEAIKQMALEKAANTEVAVSDGPSEENPFLCSDTTDEYLHILTWEYSIEYASTAIEQDIVDELEVLLQLALRPRLLSCINAQAADAAIVAEYALPVDTVSEEQSCEPELDDSNICQVYTGKMRLFLSDPLATQEADFLGRTHLQSLLDAEGIRDDSFMAERIGLGLQKTKYLGPTPTEPTGITRAGDEDGSFQNEDSGRTSIAVIAAASAAFVVIVAGLLYRRRRKTNEEGDVTCFAGSTNLHPYEPHDHDPEGPPSPLSAMIPNAYRYNDNMSVFSENDSGLSAVMEASAEDDNRSVNSDGILLSDGGYTTDAGGESQASFSFYQNETNAQSGELLGARGLAENPADLMSSSSMSDGSASPHKPFTAVSLFGDDPDESMTKEDKELLFM